MHRDRDVDRRQVLGFAVAGGAALLAGCGGSSPATKSARARTAPPADPDGALAALVDGNRRFVAGRPVRAHAVAEVRALATAQYPFAFVLGCSDSRVAPEVLFDQGLGDLFVGRTAGHVADRAVVGSVEYAVAELAVSLVVVLGHERCGAVKAALAAHGGERPGGDLGYLVAQVEPVVGPAERLGGDVLDQAVRLNVERVVTQLAAVPLLAERAGKGALRVVGARYDLDDARVRFLP